jgi:hypothetical protein
VHSAVWKVAAVLRSLFRFFVGFTLGLVRLVARSRP